MNLNKEERELMVDALKAFAWNVYLGTEENPQVWGLIKRIEEEE